MPLSPEALGRGLATVRYLYDLGVQHSRQSGLRQSAAILTFHDAVEMFLVLGLQHHDSYRGGHYNFPDYWTELANATPPVLVTQQSTMATMSRTRANFKHHAIPPARTVIEEARVHVRDFLEENTATVFGVKFDEVRLSMLVQGSQETRRHLEAAEHAMTAGQYDDAIGEIAYALHTLLTEYQQRVVKRDGTRRGLRLNRVFVSPVFGVLRGPSVAGGMPYASDDLARFANDAGEAIHELQVAVRVLGLGLDFGRWARFMSLAPAIHDFGGGQLNRTEWHRENEPPTLKECEFCYEFVIDSALHLQETL